MGEISMKLPLYECHKRVRALKIAEISYDAKKAFSENRGTDGSATITPEDEWYAPFKVDAAYLQKHAPYVGGYYVEYEDGHKSYSPAAAFEEGYTAVE